MSQRHRNKCMLRETSRTRQGVKVGVHYFVKGSKESLCWYVDI